MLWAHKNDRDTAGAAPGADAAGDAVPEGREQYWVWRKGKHDDLVLAVALACWGARRVFPRTAREWGCGCGDGRQGVALGAEQARLTDVEASRVVGER